MVTYSEDRWSLQTEPGLQVRSEFIINLSRKGDFLFFMQNLVDYGFKEVAMNYFENVGNILFLDKDFLRIYKQILKAGDYK